MEEGIQLLELARNAQRLFAKQEPREKRRLLSSLVSNCRWNDGALTATFRQPFDILVEAVATPIPARTPEGAIPAKNRGWLGDLDSNQDERSQSPLFYR